LSYEKLALPEFSLRIAVAESAEISYLGMELVATFRALEFTL